MQKITISTSGALQGEKLRERHVLIYDRIWWIQGQRAQVIQRYHPALQIISYHDFMGLVKEKGAKGVNRHFDIISTLGLWTAERLLRLNVRVDSAAAASYSYLAQNQDRFREWCEEIEPNENYFIHVIGQIGTIGALNPKLARTIQRYCPGKPVAYLRPFVETGLFRPLDLPVKEDSPFVVGWVGNADKKSKNYSTVYKQIYNHFKDNPKISFKEATQTSRVERSEMPHYYNSLDLLLITGANEGLPNPAMEAYSCGVPVLATNIGIIKEWTPPEARWLILDSDDPQLFIEKINRMAANRSGLRQLKPILRDNIVRNWQVEHHIGNWLATLFGIGGDGR